MVVKVGRNLLGFARYIRLIHVLCKILGAVARLNTILLEKYLIQITHPSSKPRKFPPTNLLFRLSTACYNPSVLV